MGKEDTGIFTLMQDMPARTCTWVQARRFGVCAIAAFSDDYMNDLLGLDGVEQFCNIYCNCGEKIKFGFNILPVQIPSFKIYDR